MATSQRSLRSSERVEPEEFSRRVSERLGDAAESVEIRYGKVDAAIPVGRLLDAVRTLKTDPGLLCDYFTFLSGVDWEEEGFELIVCVYSTRHENSVVLHCKLPKDDPRIPSLTSVYGGADWHERELHEMFGIAVDGHPNLVKLYLPEDFEGYPLRKSFRLASRTYKPWPGAKDPEEAAGGGRG